MNDTEKKLVDIVDYHIIEFASDLGYSYLNGGYGRWEDGSGKMHLLKDMNDSYLENCVNFINRGINEIENGEVDNDIKNSIISFAKKKDSDKVLKYKRLEVTDLVLMNIKKSLMDKLQDKKDELIN